MSILDITMADVRPFFGLRYLGNLTQSLRDILCPPYDVISDVLQGDLHRRSPYNAVRLERGIAIDGDNHYSNIYTRAATTFDLWQREGVLKRDEKSSFYLHRHTFKTNKGSIAERWGLGAKVRLEEFESRVILPHEDTRPADKADRLALIEVSRANFSPVMALYRHSSKNMVGNVIQSIRSEPPVFDGSYEEDQQLTLWAVSAPEVVEAISRDFSSSPLFIADGHHRYETALNYRNQVYQQSKNWSGEENSNYIMMTLIDFEDPGLVVEPYHRVVGGLTSSIFNILRERLFEIFDVTVLTERPATPMAFEEVVEKYSQKEPVIGLVISGEERFFLLSLKAENVGQRDVSAYDALHRFEGWILHNEVLNTVLGQDVGKHVDYIHDPAEALHKVSTGQSQFAFLLRSMPMDLFETLVSAGVRLPPKSTYFYPKIPTGMVFHLL